MSAEWMLAMVVKAMVVAQAQSAPPPDSATQEAVLGRAPLIRKGNQSISLNISPDVEGAIGDTIFAGGGYGYFLLDGLELRGTFAYAVMEDVAPPRSDYKMREIDAVAEYNFDLGGMVVPYAGLEIGLRRSEFGALDESGFIYGPRAGLKYFLAPNAALEFAITYRLSSNEVFINDFKPEDHDITSAIGLRIHF